MLFAKGLSPRLSDNLSKKKETSRHIINKKANLKLDYVVKKCKVALGLYIEKSVERFLEREVTFCYLRFLTKLNLKYKVENRLWAISYDLLYNTVIEDRFLAGPESDCLFDVRLKGKLKIKDAEFVSDSNDKRVLEILEKLNNPLITERISSMDLTNFKISYRKDTRLWKVNFRSLIGSTTWNFIPPVTYLIKPKEEECVKIVELFELIGDALVRPQQENSTLI